MTMGGRTSHSSLARGTDGMVKRYSREYLATAYSNISYRIAGAGGFRHETRTQ